MLTREQIYTMLLLRERENIFSILPNELIECISDFGQNPNSDIAKALLHAAYAQKEDIAEVVKMIKINPSLLLQAGNVITPGGLMVKRVTLYEFFLGAGDPDAARQIEFGFRKIKGGENERMRQYERYRPHIEGMLTQAPYDLTSLIEIIKNASTEDVTILLNRNMTHASKLRDAVIQFRKDFSPGVLIKPRMHFNYLSFQHALEILKHEWNDLHHRNGNNWHKIDLVLRCLIGFEMRRFPGIDRCAIAQGLCDIVGKNHLFNRSYQFKYRSGSFPVTTTDDSLEGLGSDFAVEAILKSPCIPTVLLIIPDFKEFISSKHDKLLKLMQPQQVHKCAIS